MSDRFSDHDRAIAMDVLERFMSHDEDSSRSRCIEALVPYFGYRDAKGMVDGMTRIGALKQTDGRSRCFRVVLRKGPAWSIEYNRTHRGMDGARTVNQRCGRTERHPAQAVIR